MNRYPRIIPGPILLLLMSKPSRILRAHSKPTPSHVVVGIFNQDQQEIPKKEEAKASDDSKINQQINLFIYSNSCLLRMYSPPDSSYSKAVNATKKSDHDL